MDQRIMVFGSAVTDLTAITPHLPVPGETVPGLMFRSGPGGKGSNQAVAAHRAGAKVTLFTKLGNDHMGNGLRDFYREEGMEQSGLLTDHQYETATALIMIDEQTAENAIVVTLGACGHFTDEDIELAKTYIDKSDLVVCQLETNLAATAAVLQYAHAKGKTTVFNPAPANPDCVSLIPYTDIITPNETETRIITGVKITDQPQSIRTGAQRLLELGARKVVITLGKKGCYATDGNEEEFIPALTLAPVVDTTGAGDAFTGGLAAGLARGLEFFPALHFASVISGLAVTRFGTAPAMPRETEILAHYHKLCLSSRVDNTK